MKSWRFDGPSVVMQEMIADAQASPEQFACRGVTASEELQCEVCLRPIEAWTTYHYTCFIEDGEAQFIRQHIFCPRENL